MAAVLKTAMGLHPSWVRIPRPPRSCVVELQRERALRAVPSSSLKEILDAPVSALAGVTDKDAEHLAAAFNIKTVRDLGSNKYFATAGVLVALSNHTD